MNKDLLLIFVIGPLVVEIGKAVIKELQDRRNTQKIGTPYTGTFRPLVTDLERSFGNCLDNRNQEDMRVHTLKLLATTAEMVRGPAVPADVKTEHAKLMGVICSNMFNGDLTPEQCRDVQDQVSVVSKELLSKAWEAGKR